MEKSVQSGPFDMLVTRTRRQPTRGFSVLVLYRDYVLHCYPKTKTNMFVIESKDCHRVQGSSGDFQCLECGQHLALKFLVMDIQRMKVLGRTTTLGPTHPSQYRFDHLLPQDQQRRQRPDAGSAHSIPPRFTDSLHQRLAPQLAQVVS